MINTLYGKKNDHYDIAKKVIKKSISEPFIRIVRNFDDRFMFTNLSLSFLDTNGEKVVQIGRAHV